MAMVCVPVMLCFKPVLLYCKSRMFKRVKMATLDGEQYFEMEVHDQTNRRLSGHLEDNSDEFDGGDLDFGKSFSEELNDESFSDEEGDEHGGHDGGADFGEIFIHQLIETIEYVLGSISNTASYLRLWALSLAHGQLANVFLTLLMGQYLTQPSGVVAGIIGNVIGYFFLALATFAVLLVMDQMECFLHALRLHWVEFQSKFFKGGGYAFNALSLVNESKKLDKTA